ncbi:phosphoribosylamine--glycine ligase [Aerococcaceae bacterium DSM 111020]|nr:phosphoribosylamine--glycine ligase [Aerococcaceae bacterium DSM 111020]
MKVLIIGAGGREHALGWKIAQSPAVNRLYFAPGNAGTGEMGVNVPIAVTNIPELCQFAVEKAIDLTIVGPEEPLCLGIVDAFENAGLKIFGPNQKCAQFESSKDFTKAFLTKHHIHTAAYQTYTDYDEAIAGLKKMNYPIVIKADGLALGKGVVIAESEKVARETIDSMMRQACFGQAGSTIVIEEFLNGPEISLLCFVSHNRIIPMDLARDYKKALDGDLGLNTGGVGCFSPVHIDDALQNKIQTVCKQIEDGLNADGFDYTGILFIGFIIQEGKPYVLEFNVRFGDPETEVLLPRLESDLYLILQKAIDGQLKSENIQWSDEATVAVILTSQGYPETYLTNGSIELPEEQIEKTLLFHNGTIKEDNIIKNIGGRVLTAVGMGQTKAQARQLAYQLVAQIKCDQLRYRQDIAL